MYLSDSNSNNSGGDGVVPKYHPSRSVSSACPSDEEENVVGSTEEENATGSIEKENATSSTEEENATGSTEEDKKKKDINANNQNGAIKRPLVVRDSKYPVAESPLPQKLTNGFVNPETPRNEEVLALRNKFPTKVPIIIKRYVKEVALPHMDKSKYLVPQEITMSQFQTIIRNRMQMGPSTALYLLVNNRTMISMSTTLAEIYTQHAGPDGFLYITYASQEVFG